MPIERKINEPPTDLSKSNILLTGRKKIGKTSLAAQWDESHICEFEPGNAIHIKCSYTDVGTLKDLNDFLKEAAKTTWVKTWIFDDIAAPYDWCFEKICKQEGFSDPGELSHGKGWGLIKREYMSYIHKIFNLPGGKLFTAHATQKTIKTVSKKEITTYECDYGATIRKNLEHPKLHNVWIMEYLRNERVLIIQGDEYYQACTANLDEHFKTPDGKAIKMIPLGKTAKEGYENILACYRNELVLDENYLVSEVDETGDKPKSSPVKAPQKVSFSL